VSPAFVVTLTPIAGWLFQVSVPSVQVVTTLLTVNVTEADALDCEYRLQGCGIPIAPVGMFVRLNST
jgi:hypothetical protein